MSQRTKLLKSLTDTINADSTFRKSTGTKRKKSKSSSIRKKNNTRKKTTDSRSSSSLPRKLSRSKSLFNATVDEKKRNTMKNTKKKNTKKKTKTLRSTQLQQAKNVSAIARKQANEIEKLFKTLNITCPTGACEKCDTNDPKSGCCVRQKLCEQYYNLIPSYMNNDKNKNMKKVPVTLHPDLVSFRRSDFCSSDESYKAGTKQRVLCNHLKNRSSMTF